MVGVVVGVVGVVVCLVYSCMGGGSVHFSKLVKLHKMCAPKFRAALQLE